jgi:hypothetical protein
MNDDYLWDKTGEPDPQIQQLEEILGTFRYQPKPLEIPKDLGLPRRRNHVPWIAIAASLLLAVLAGAVWLITRSSGEAPVQQANVKAPAAVEEKAISNPAPTLSENNQLPDKNEVAVHVTHSRRSSVPALSKSVPALSKQEREEALMAKEQVMLALRLTTEKLSLVHKKTQNTNPANQIKNQHRVG